MKLAIATIPLPFSREHYIIYYYMNFRIVNTELYISATIIYNLVVALRISCIFIYNSRAVITSLIIKM